MGYNLLDHTEFLGVLKQKEDRGGIAEVNKWVVEIVSGYIINSMCEQISFPGKTLITNELSRTYGPYTKMPYGYLYNDIMLTFKCSGRMNEKTFFEEWQNEAILKNNECSFYYDYVDDVKIHQLDRNGDITHTVILYECYPSAITEVPLDYNTENSYNRLNVTLTYYSWGVAKVQTQTPRHRFVNPNPVGVSPAGVIRDAAGDDFTTV